MGGEGFKEIAIQPLKQFAKYSMHLVKKCTKPDRKEFTAITKATGVGFGINVFNIGLLEYFYKCWNLQIHFYFTPQIRLS